MTIAGKIIFDDSLFIYEKGRINRPFLMYAQNKQNIKPQIHTLYCNNFIDIFICSMGERRE